MDATSQDPEVLGGELVLVFVTCDLLRVTSEAACSRTEARRDGP